MEEWPLEAKGAEPAALVPAESAEPPQNTSGEAGAPSSACQIPPAILSPTAPPPPTPPVPLVSATDVRPQCEQSPVTVVGQEEEEFCDV
eukprot:NODE_21663_length_742_cov_3.767480.p2 GENE.NODE_21663_length_742_cov_3.767480~~NODE_21663_length_742_cov_3.767480.p2  ORF type:complete len:98 (+),score=13.40 NODE_21663_length_742_cov_3.767480:30-296(+)